MTREQMLAIRTKGLGASDMSDVLSLPPYGCSRRLWYQKQGAAPDHPRKDSAVLDRGHALEALIIQELARELKGKAESRETTFHPDKPHLFAHLDAWFCRGTVAVHGECKTMGRDVYMEVRRTGLPEAYIAQAQYAMHLTTLRAADGDPLYPAPPMGTVFALLWPDGWQFEFLRVKRDPTAGEDLVAVADEWWMRHMVMNEPPERLSARDTRCGKCEYRTTCQGAAMLEVAGEEGRDVKYEDMGEGFGDLLDAYAAAKEREAAAVVEAERLKEEIKVKLGDRQAVDVPGYRVYFRATPFKEYTVTGGVKRALRVYPR